LTTKRLDKRTLLIFWVSFAAIYLTASGIFSYLAPVGHWRTIVLGVTFLGHYDPGGPYMGSGIQFFGFQEYPYFVGHPGLTLQLIVYIVAKLYYLIHQIFGPDETYIVFAAKNFHRVAFLSRLTMTGMHVVSFYLVFLFSRRIIDNDRVAALAALGYATSFPVLLFLLRIALEPLIVIFFLLTVFSIWKYQSLAPEGRAARVLPYLVFAAASSAAGFYTKINLLGLLPVLPLFFILWGRGLNGERIEWKKKTLFSGAYLIASASFMYLGNLKVDWDKFFAFWFGFAPGSPQYDTEHGFFGNVISKVGSLAAGYLKAVGIFITEKIPLYFTWSYWGVITVSEFLFLIVCAIGIILVQKERPQRKSLLITPLLYAGLTLLIFIYRNGLHYTIVMLPVLSVLFGYGLYRLVERLMPGASLRRAVVMVLAVLVVHFIPIFAMVDSHLTDAARYERLAKPYYNALETIEPDERIAVLCHGETMPNGYLQTFRFFRGYYPNAEMLRALKNIIIFVNVDAVSPNILVSYLKENRVGIVIYEPEGFPLPSDTSDYKPLRIRESKMKDIKGPMGLDEFQELL
jgi:hypothetical protein